MPVSIVNSSVLALMFSLVAFMSWVLAVMLGYIFPAAPGHHSPATGSAGHVIILLMLVSGLLGPVVLVTAMVAMVSVKRSGGTLKDNGLALLAIALAGVPYILARFLPNPW